MRGKPVTKRQVTPDPKFNRVDIAKFINKIMRRGKKTVAQSIVYNAFEYISNKTKQDPISIYDAAMRNVSPNLEVKGKRIGGSNYQVPIVVIGDRKLTLAHRWLIKAAQSRKGAAMSARLGEELIAAAKGEGEAMKKREDIQRMAESNKAFAHFA
ncbi:MAG: 30S ribosomal protein S7 [Candidatus Komeilibacteria bacterium CG11_big_fil_rev_8_21_14_0_20_36_20]|uniref:Small ribosomal subunit protein uS7 n=1 Tax=Candidatus Komeilibacteria bacterium CG11_big_fil_rev_8_21_14_0_20_36_20 TaxID=1974477 RepID=A0A2H0NDR7_9BACT|nr:MAG: 30S ribosomal protein S7 [Candidatus Komeilibacteria bacterium CG11_big_fil_rev_8_21_14_0_20_36_20]PIR81411.1 MAG: 30S ribosomal protein S7 [Candidatus Komeilibacteria bacterium CG10_big_fil_rev_8_21_14_0_10_36_65]PJC55137.1 MAG: 30S ribosomal protein S7 [Candidatus Komeilibacteria bacterium CG_4_9_14_0_2_um_filter_36_13]